MVEQVRAYMEQWNMVPPGGHVIVGLSGGADSVCLCLVLRELSADMGFSMSAVHVEHGIRGKESLADAAFAGQLCRSLDIPCEIVHVNVPEYAMFHHMGEEEAARELRYGVFAEHMHRCEGTSVAVALAHHMEDNAETMLFQLVRGTGLDGLCGMQPVRQDTDGCRYIRPLLGMDRRSVELFLALRGQDYCTDSTNRETVYSRNHIRHDVMPLLSEVNAQAVMHMNQTAQRLRELRDYVECVALAEYKSVVQRNGKEIRLAVEPLIELPQVLQSRIIHRALGEAAGARKDITAAHIEAVRQLASRQTGRQINLPYQLTARREYSYICLGKAVQHAGIETVQVSAQQLARCAHTGEVLSVGFGSGGQRLELRIFERTGNMTEISSKIYTKWFDYDMIKNGFFIRSRRQGDYFVMDAAGHHKKLSDYLTDAKIPAGERDLIPLLARESEVLWIIGGRMGQSAMITADTRSILEVAYTGGTEDGLQDKA